MHITRTINYGWNTINEPYNAECSECGKLYPRTTSTGFNDLATQENIQKYRDQLKEEAEQLSKKKIVCNKCTKAKLAKPETVSLISTAMLAEMKAIEEGYTALNAKAQAFTKRIRKNDGRLFYYKDALYVQSSADYSDYYVGFTISGDRMSKTRPWETTEDHIYGAKIAEVQYCNVTLDDLKKAAKG